MNGFIHRSAQKKYNNSWCFIILWWANAAIQSLNSLYTNKCKKEEEENLNRLSLKIWEQVVKMFLVSSCLGCVGEWFDEAKIHSLEQTGASRINGLLPFVIVLSFACHWQDFQHLTFNQLFGQLAVIRVEHVVDNHDSTMLYLWIMVETQPLQDLQPLRCLMGKGSPLGYREGNSNPQRFKSRLSAPLWKPELHLF